jgi:hypothetical protein
LIQPFFETWGGHHSSSSAFDTAAITLLHTLTMAVSHGAVRASMAE